MKPQGEIEAEERKKSHLFSRVDCELQCAWISSQSSKKWVSVKRKRKVIRGKIMMIKLYMLNATLFWHQKTFSHVEHTVEICHYIDMFLHTFNVYKIYYDSCSQLSEMIFYSIKHRNGGHPKNLLLSFSFRKMKIRWLNSSCWCDARRQQFINFALYFNLLFVITKYSQQNEVIFTTTPLAYQCTG